MRISEQAKRLVEALHEVNSLEQRWSLVQFCLDEERRIAVTEHCATRAERTAATLAEKIAQDHGHAEG